MAIDLSSISKGQSASTEIVVGTRDTAHHIGSGMVKVFATPVMVTLLEEAALLAVEGLLPEGYQSVGTRLNVSHIAATPVGSRVTAHAEVTEVDGRLIKFNVRAEDDHELIGEGTHERIIVDVNRFDERVEKKIASKS